MEFDTNRLLDSIKDGTSAVEEVAHEKLNTFHNNYISTILPDCGKYGDVAKFTAEMIPGVSEYNAIKDGDWQAFAIAAGIDIAAIGVGILTAGTGFVALKGGSAAAKASLKVATKEIAEASIEKLAKEAAESSTEKIAKDTLAVSTKKLTAEIIEGNTQKLAREAVETSSEKLARATTEASTERLAKETAESSTEILAKETAEKDAKNLAKPDKSVSQIEKNMADGKRREELVSQILSKKYGADNIFEQRFLYDKDGNFLLDPITNKSRRLDFVVTNNNKVIKSYEVTSLTASKDAQIKKELDILKYAQEHGGAFIKNPNTKELIPFNVETEIWRLE